MKLDRKNNLIWPFLGLAVCLGITFLLLGKPEEGRAAAMLMLLGIGVGGLTGYYLFRMKRSIGGEGFLGIFLRAFAFATLTFAVLMSTFIIVFASGRVPPLKGLALVASSSTTFGAVIALVLAIARRR